MESLPAEYQSFKSDTLGSMITIQYQGERWILAKTVCDTLGYKNIYAMLSRYVSARNKTHVFIQQLADAFGAHAPTLFVNKDGFMEILAHAKKNPKAKEMRDWFFGSIAKKGAAIPAPIRKREVVELDERYGLALHKLHEENQELKQKLGNIEASLQELLSSMRINGTNWKEAAKIIAKSGPRDQIQNRFHELYQLLEQGSHVNLRVRRDNLQKKYPSRKISILDAIGEDAKLVSIFIIILRNYALTHGINIQINDTSLKGAA